MAYPNRPPPPRHSPTPKYFATLNLLSGLFLFDTMVLLYVPPLCTGQTRVVSRWSKYVDRGENGPEGDDEHQEEEENVYTDTEQCRQRNIRLEQWLWCCCCWFFPR